MPHRLVHFRFERTSALKHSAAPWSCPGERKASGAGCEAKPASRNSWVEAASETKKLQGPIIQYIRKATFLGFGEAYRSTRTQAVRIFGQ